MSDLVDESGVCPKCGHQTVVPDDERDGEIECENCGELFTPDEWDDDEGPHT